MASKLGIIELLQRVGEDNVLLQNLTESATNFQAQKKGLTAITFITDGMNCTEAFGLTEFGSKPRNVGLVLWLPTELVDKAKADHDREAESTGSNDTTPQGRDI